MSKDDNDLPEVDEAIVDALKQRRADHAVIAAGKLPRLRELYAGAPWFGGRMDLDIQAWAADVLASGETVNVEAIQRLRDTCTTEALSAARKLTQEGAVAERLDIYLACIGDDDARHRVARDISETVRGWRSGRSIGWLYRLATMRGLQADVQVDMVRYCEIGIHDLRNTGVKMRALDTAQLVLDVRSEAGADAETIVAEDRAEVVKEEPPAVLAHSLVVVPTLDIKKAGGARRDIYKSWEGKSGEPLPLITRGDVGAHAGALVSQWPHAIGVIETILADLSAREPIRLRPTLLVGPPGCGKSTLARAIAEQLGLPVELVGLAGLADGSVMGTSAQWSTARESIPLQLIRRTGTANPCVIWDEIDKVGDSKHNGNAADALLPMLEPGQARAYRDLALEVEVDLSMVSHLATANEIDSVAMPLRNRLRIIQMPEPGWQHIGPLVRGIVDEIAKDRGLDLRWHPPLAEDEMDLVRQAWPGGSIRQLQRIVGIILDGRDMIIGRA